MGAQTTHAGNVEAFTVTPIAGETYDRVPAYVQVDSTGAPVPAGTSASPTVMTSATSSTGTVTSVANSTSTGTLLASNASRLGATLYNDDTAAILKIKLGTAASTSSFTYAMPPGGYFEVPFGYTGIVTGIASVATGNARITELV